jgi:hypothetical protein
MILGIRSDDPRQIFFSFLFFFFCNKGPMNTRRTRGPRQLLEIEGHCALLVAKEKGEIKGKEAQLSGTNSIVEWPRYPRETQDPAGFMSWSKPSQPSAPALSFEWLVSPSASPLPYVNNSRAVAPILQSTCVCVWVCVGVGAGGGRVGSYRRGVDELWESSRDSSEEICTAGGPSMLACHL